MKDVNRANRGAGAPSGVDGAVAVAGLFLLGFGVVMSYSATAPLDFAQRVPPLFLKHGLAALAGLAVAALSMQVPLPLLRRIAFPLWILGVALLLATAIAGVEVNGARRWLDLPGTGVRFQPSELARLFTVLAVAALVARRDGRRELEPRRAVGALGLAALPIGLLIVQPDLGGAVLLAALVGVVLFAAGAPLRHLGAAALAAPFAIAAYAWTQPYAWRRLLSFRDPWDQYRDGGFQLVQSIIAFNQGGLTGVGLGNGRQKLFYLPETHTDFILSLVGEELGLLGVLAVLGAFAALVVAGARIARRARDRFALLTACGMTAMLTLPAAVNAAVVMGLLPTKGLALPFLSYGRSSLLACCAAAGILLGIARSEAGQPAGAGRSAPPRRWRRS